MLNISKFIPTEDLAHQRVLVRDLGKQLVLTNGCFDLLHAGHVYSLESAAKQGDVLWVGVNSDESVRQLKGSIRPIYDEKARLYILNALQCVQGVFLFQGNDLSEEIKKIQPDVYVKAGDYSLEKLNTKERLALEDCHAKILFMPFLKGWSTTSTIKKLSGICNN